MNDLAKENVIKINNNPLILNGRIGRLAYFLTIFAVNLMIECLKYITKTFYYSDVAIPIYIIGICILFIIQLFAIVKRLRDININVWFALLLYIPYVNIIGHILLICIKSSCRLSEIQQ